MARRRLGCATTYALLLAVLLMAGTSGCASSGNWVTLRDSPRNPLAEPLQLLSRSGPKPTPRTSQLLRRYNLASQLHGDRSKLLSQLEELQQREPHREIEYAMAELAYIAAKQKEKTNNTSALEYYGAALIHAYRYLFDDSGGLASNPYDPQFRGASDLYNQSLEGMLRIVQKHDLLQPGSSKTVKTANHTCLLHVTVRSNAWHEDDFDRFEFVSDYQVQGLRNHYHTFGLGVPLIAVRRSHVSEHPAEEFYPPSLAFPVTAFLRVLPAEPGTAADNAGLQPSNSSALDSKTLRFVLELYDPLDRGTVEVADRHVPLEADLSTPLAYFLSQPALSKTDVSTVGLLFPDRVKQVQGLYMLEPFQSNKMPVVMVHGLWSSPLTWMEMFNDLRSDPVVRQHYQFWFYLYPTGQPFWISAAQMREDLAEMRGHIDPQHRHPALDQMVLVGHSMGGLVSKLQTVESGNEFWQTMSDRPFSEIKADEDIRETLADAFFFQPNSSIRRVVTIGTPHRGSSFSNDTTRWLGRKLIDIPSRLLAVREQLLGRNHDFFRPDAPLEIKTSIDSLAPDSPLLPVLLTADPAPWVSYHNVVGNAPDMGWKSHFLEEGDGVVSVESARLDAMQQLRSQIIVPAEHVAIHRHPQSILEVRRVLFEQLAEVQEFRYGVNVASRQAPLQAERHPAVRLLPPVDQP